MSMNERALVLALSLAWSNAWSAGDGSDAPEGAYFEELPIVLTVSRMPQSLADAPGAVTVLDRETIRATGYRQLPDLLRLVPGFNVGYLRGWQASVAYHGFAGQLSSRVLVLIDGRPINGEFLSGAVDWLSQPLAIDDIERIEVLRGFNPAAYGSNAFLGVVNIITRHASLARGAYAQLSRGDHGIADGILRLGGSLGAAADFRVTVARREDDGLTELPDSDRLSFATFRGDLRPSASDELSLNLGMQNGKGGEGYASVPANPPRDRHVGGDFQQLRWRRAFSPENELQLQLYRNHDEYVDEGRADLVRVGMETLDLPDAAVRQVLAVLGLPSVLPFDLNRHSERRSVELQHHFRVAPSLRLGWGAELRRDEAKALTFFDTTSSIERKTQRLFGNLEWRALPPLLLHVGVMVERVKDAGFADEALRRRSALGVSAEQAAGADTDVMPRLFANYQLAPGHVLRAGYSEASRAPSLFESRGQQVVRVDGRPLPAVFDEPPLFGNPGLERERVSALEINYLGQLPFWHARLDVRLFRERLSGLIDNLGSVAPFGNTYINAGSLRTRGLEYQLRFQPARGSSFALAQAFTEIYGGPTDAAAAGFRVAEDFRQSAPPHSTSLMWTQQLPLGFSFSIIHYAVGAIRWLDFGQRVDGYRRTDGRFSYRFETGYLRGDISVTGLNLFGEYNEFRNGEPPETHVVDRRLFGTVRLEF
jgi:iron complex outermembrane receptor protein